MFFEHRRAMASNHLVSASFFFRKPAESIDRGFDIPAVDEEHVVAPVNFPENTPKRYPAGFWDMFEQYRSGVQSFLFLNKKSGAATPDFPGGGFAIILIQQVPFPA